MFAGHTSKHVCRVQPSLLSNDCYSAINRNPGLPAKVKVYADLPSTLQIWFPETGVIALGNFGGRSAGKGPDQGVCGVFCVERNCQGNQGFWLGQCGVNCFVRVWVSAALAPRYAGGKPQPITPCVRVLFGPGRFGRMRRSPWRRWSSSHPCGPVIRRSPRRGHHVGGRSPSRVRGRSPR